MLTIHKINRSRNEKRKNTSWKVPERCFYIILPTFFFASPWPHKQRSVAFRWIRATCPREKQKLCALLKCREWNGRRQRSENVEATEENFGVWWRSRASPNFNSAREFNMAWNYFTSLDHTEQKNFCLCKRPENSQRKMEVGHMIISFSMEKPASRKENGCSCSLEG